VSYKDFFQEPENRKYIKYENIKEVENVYNFMCKPERIDKMIMASNQNRPALEGIIEDIELAFPRVPNFDIQNDYFLRKALGSMVKHIISDFGYEINIQKDISKGSYIKSATHYKFDESKAKKRLVRTLTIENI